MKLKMYIESIFGKEAGILLFDEAHYESIFEATNCPDSQKMERWDGPLH